MFKEIDLQHHAVVVVGFNRLLSITRLLKSLSIAYYDEEVALVISIDKSDDQDVYSFVDNFQWKHGNKYVIIQEKRRGLKEHIYRCGDLSKFFKSVTILEDDISVSPYFFSYVKNAVEVYGDDENVAGISLYKNEFNGFNSLPLYFLNNGYDVFAYQSTSTWGETFTYSMWNKFRTWLSDWDEDFSKVDTYCAIKSWNKAWSKYYEAYIILTNKYFIYPYLSVSTNNNDAGTHVKTLDINNSYQVEMLYGSRVYQMPKFDMLLRYDTYAQFEGLKDICGMNDIAIDLYGNRENIVQRYLLSIRHLNFKIIKHYGIRLRPIELNVLLDIPGNGIYLYDTQNIEHNHFVERTQTLQEDYYLRDFAPRLLLSKTKRNIIRHIKQWLRKL